jgi:hypothetical protein
MFSKAQAIAASIVLGAVTAQLMSRRSAPHDAAIQTPARLPARYARI